jgi:hypothetical protein
MYEYVWMLKYISAILIIHNYIYVFNDSFNFVLLLPVLISSLLFLLTYKQGEQIKLSFTLDSFSKNTEVGQSFGLIFSMVKITY